MKFIFILLIIFFTSCKRQSSNTGIQNELIIIDTINIDPNQYLPTIDLRTSEVRGDSLTYLDTQQNSLVTLNLKSNEISNMLTFAEQGPNSINYDVYSYRTNLNNNILLSAENKINVYNKSGIFLKNIMLLDSNNLKSDIADFLKVTSDCAWSGNDKYYCLYDSLNARNTGLFVFDLNTGQYEIESVKGISKFNEFDFPKMKYRPSIDVFNDKVFITHPCSNEIMIWNPNTKKLINKTYQSEITPNKQSFKNIDKDNVLALIQATRKQVQFNNFIYDPNKNLYFRLSIIPSRDSSNNDENTIAIMAFDEHLEQISELEIKSKTFTDFFFLFKGNLYLPQYTLDENLFFIIIQLSTIEI
jgi:hypothetical protein